MEKQKNISEADYIKYILRDQKLQLEFMKKDSQFSPEDIAEMEERIENLKKEYRHLIAQELEMEKSEKKL